MTPRILGAGSWEQGDTQEGGGARFLTHRGWSRNASPGRGGLSRVCKNHGSQPGPRACKHQGQRPETVSEHHSRQTAGRTDIGNLGNSEAVYFPFLFLIKETLGAGLDLHKIVKFFSTHTTPAPFSSP